MISLNIIGLLLISTSCSSINLKPKKEYLWSYQAINNNDKYILRIYGTRHINNFEQERIKEYQLAGVEFGKKNAYVICTDGYSIIKEIPIHYESIDCSKEVIPARIHRINIGEEPFPDYCKFPIYEMTINCSQSNRYPFLNNSNNLFVVLGSYDPDVIEKIINKNILKVERCVNQEVKRTEIEFKGIVNLTFSMNEKGHVINSKANSSDLVSKPILTCIEREIKNMKFPKPNKSENVEIKIPLEINTK